MYATINTSYHQPIHSPLLLITSFDHHTLSPHFVTPLCHHTLSPHFVTTLCHHTLSPHFVTPLCHHTLSPHFVTTLCHHTLSPHFVTPLCHPTLSSSGGAVALVQGCVRGVVVRDAKRDVPGIIKLNNPAPEASIELTHPEVSYRDPLSLHLLSYALITPPSNIYPCPRSQHRTHTPRSKLS